MNLTTFLGDIRNCFNIKLFLCKKVYAVYYSEYSLSLSLLPLTFLQRGHRGQLYINDNKVKNLLHWIKIKADSGELKNSVIGGYYPYPPVPKTFSKYRSSLKGTNVIASFLMIHLYAICMLCYIQESSLFLHFRGVSQSIATLTDNNFIFMKT